VHTQFATCRLRCRFDVASVSLRCRFVSRFGVASVSLRHVCVRRQSFGAEAKNLGTLCVQASLSRTVQEGRTHENPVGATLKPKLTHIHKSFHQMLLLENIKCQNVAVALFSLKLLWCALRVIQKQQSLKLRHLSSALQDQIIGLNRR